jgi:uncharacterized protein YbjT (DUF2867 family)
LIDSGYFRAKLAQEQLIVRAPIPYSIVRATQFFEFIGAIADSATRGGHVHLPPVQIRPIAADDVANALAAVATRSPVNGTIDVTGPETFLLTELVQRLLVARSDHRTVVADRDMPYFSAQVTEGTLVPLGESRIGAVRFDDWLRAQ